MVDSTEYLIPLPISTDAPLELLVDEEELLSQSVEGLDE